MKNPGRSTRAATLVMTFVVVLSGVGSARAESDLLTRRLAKNTSLSYARYPRGRTLVRLPLISLGVGERRLITARLAARNGSRSPMNQQVGINCRYGDGAHDGTRTSRNNQGKTVRYAAGNGVMTLDVRYLVSAREPTTVACSLWGQSSGTSLIALGAKRTFITITRSPQTLAQQWSASTCSSNGRDRGCLYLVPRTVRQHRYPTAAYAVSERTFTADPRARAIDVIGDIEFTSCYRQTASCAPAVSRFGGGYRSRAVVETRLEAFQLDARGNPCSARTYDPAPRRGNGTQRAYRRSTITHVVHHFKVHHRLGHRLAVNPACTPTFLIRLYARSVAGDPVKIEGTKTIDQAGSSVTRTYTNAIARNVY